MSKLNAVVSRDFLAFAKKALFDLDGTTISDDRYVGFLAFHLANFAAGGSKRFLLVNMPPRHLKTALCSIALAAWILGHDPDKKVLIVTYGEGLAKQIARSIRSILRANWYREAFQTRIAKDHSSVLHFATKSGGEVKATSIDGSITGFGADVIIVDDPHNIADAGDAKMMQRAIERFTAVVMSRFNEPRTGRAIVVAHRISDVDLSASLLGDDAWERVVLPLVATRDELYRTPYGDWHRRTGEFLRADSYDTTSIKKLKNIVNPTFDLLYQQDCDAQALPCVKAEDFGTCRRSHVANLPCVISVDPGSGKSGRTSFNVVQVWAFDQDCYYLLQQARERCEFSKLATLTKATAKRFYRSPILIEATACGPALFSNLPGQHRNRVVPIEPRGSKSARLRPHLEKILGGRIRLLEDADFKERFIREVVEFPHGRHADQVDAMSQALTWIDENRGIAEIQQQRGRPGLAAVAYGSARHGYGPASLVASNSGAVIAVRSGSSAANAPFPTVKAWVAG
jgi:phage terminase large subunit-like protein